MANVYLMVGLLTLIEGCQHPKALYEEPERPPLTQGRTLEQKYQYAEAAQQYERIDDVIIRDMALNHLMSAWGSVNANIVRSQQAVNEQPDSAKARLRLAQDDYTKGLLCTRYTSGIVGPYPKDFVLGEQEFFYSEALLQAQKSLQLQPDLPEAHLLIGEIYLANRRNDDALKELKRLIGKQPDFARGYYAIGKVYLDLKNYELTERYLIHAILLDPTLYDAYYLLGKFYLEKEWFDFAAATFLEMLRHRPQDSPAFELLVNSCHKLAQAYMQQEQYDRAIQLFQEILKVKSAYAPGFKLTTQSLENLKKEGISGGTLEGLRLLENQEFTTEEEFLNAVKTQIGNEQAVRYKELLLKYAVYDERQRLLLARQKQKEALAKKQETAATAKETTAQPTVSASTALLFADQSLDALLRTLDPKDDAEFGQALKNIQEQKFQEGYNILQTTPDKNQKNPYRRLAVAFAQQQLGKGEEAKQTLRQLTGAADVEARIKLWAWTALRSLGEQPDQKTAAQVLGVVFEVPIPEQTGFDVLAAYADGSVHYINYSGKAAIWDTPHPSRRNTG